MVDAYYNPSGPSLSRVRLTQRERAEIAVKHKTWQREAALKALRESRSRYHDATVGSRLEEEFEGHVRIHPGTQKITWNDVEQFVQGIDSDEELKELFKLADTEPLTFLS